MKPKRANQLFTGILTLALMGAMSGCVKDLYDPESGVSKLPPKEDYFDFSLTGLTHLSVNYDVPGLTSVIEVYDQNPMLDHKTKKEGINPIYVAYINDGKYTGDMYIPTAVKEAYVYSSSIATPTCVKLTATADGFTYDSTQKEGVDTRNSTLGPSPNFAVGIVDKTMFPYEVATTLQDGGKRNDNLFSITAWTPRGWECINLKYYTQIKKIGAANEDIGIVSGRLEGFLAAQKAIDNNNSLLRNPKDINLKVPTSATEGMSVNVTYMGERASFHNTFGYYYYEDKGQTLTPQEFYNIRKYVIIPNVDANNMTVGETVKLLYFDESGKQSDKFPANYVIGWFVFSNGFGINNPHLGEGGGTNGGIIRQLPADAYTSVAAYSQGRFSCMSDDTDTNRRFISLYDTKSKLRVIGIEDNPYSTPDDYMDVMFVAQTTPDLGAGELPPITDPDEPAKPEVTTWSVSGTLGFEDIWPNGGDYDLNDVLVEYHRELTIDKDNIVTKVKETFKPVQKPGSATQDNFFACQFGKAGKITVPAGVLFESATNSIVLEASAKTIVGNSYIIERDLTGLGLKQVDIQTDFNPYLITKKYATERRIEVHLPKKDMTSAADRTLMTEENAYFISSGGIYPFAIDVPVTEFIPTDETKKIDDAGQYPEFREWATSKGERGKEWYLKGKGKK